MTDHIAAFGPPNDPEGDVCRVCGQWAPDCDGRLPAAGDPVLVTLPPSSDEVTGTNITIAPPADGAPEVRVEDPSHRAGPLPVYVGHLDPCPFCRKGQPELVVVFWVPSGDGVFANEPAVFVECATCHARGPRVALSSPPTSLPARGLELKAMAQDYAIAVLNWNRSWHGEKVPHGPA